MFLLLVNFCCKGFDLFGWRDLKKYPQWRYCKIQDHESSDSDCYSSEDSSSSQCSGREPVPSEAAASGESNNLGQSGSEHLQSEGLASSTVAVSNTSTGCGTLSVPQEKKAWLSWLEFDHFLDSVIANDSELQGSYCVHRVPPEHLLLNQSLVGKCIAFRWNVGWSVGRITKQAQIVDQRKGYNFWVRYRKEKVERSHMLTLDTYSWGELACIGSWFLLTN